MVWKKPDDNASHPEPAPAPPRPAAPPAETRRPDRATATIGPSIFIKGDLSGDEDLVIEGRVESFSPAGGSQFSLLPPENATGNFIKIVQRVPVKIIIDKGLDPKVPLPLGISAVPTVTVR